MKVSDLTEQLQRRKSPEELAAMKAAPDYWKKVARRDFNALINRYGATSKERAILGDDDRFIDFNRVITVLVSGENSMTLHRDKRAAALLQAVGKFIHSYLQSGYKVSIDYWSRIGMDFKGFDKEATLEKVMEVLNDKARLQDLIDAINNKGDRGEKLPLVFNLRFIITKLPTG